MDSYPPSTALVLVAILPSERDLEIARLLGWYHIPLRTAPKVVEVDYLAFYQTAKFGEDHHWRIETYTEVRGVELVSRLELFRDEPGHPRAHEEYYKIQIGPLEHLPVPILAGKWRRLTFIYTTGELLMAAKNLQDLVVRSGDRDVLWRSLRERAIQGGRYQAEELPEIPIPPDLIAFLDGLNPS